MAGAGMASERGHGARIAAGGNGGDVGEALDERWSIQRRACRADAQFAIIVAAPAEQLAIVQRHIGGDHGARMGRSRRDLKDARTCALKTEFAAAIHMGRARRSRVASCAWPSAIDTNL